MTSENSSQRSKLKQPVVRLEGIGRSSSPLPLSSLKARNRSYVRKFNSPY